MGSSSSFWTTGAGAGAGCSVTGGIGIGGTSGAGGGVSSGILSSGIFIDSRGAMGSGAGATISTFGSGNGPTGSPSSPVSPSGTEDGAATGSEKTGSILVVLVMSSIAFCRSLSTVLFWSIIAHLLYYTYVYNSTDLLNAQEVYDFIEEIEFDFFHGETSAESVDDGLAATLGEVDFDADTEAFFRDEDGGEVVVFLEDAKGSKFVVFVKLATFDEAVRGELIIDFAWGSKSGDKDSDDAQNNEDEKSPPA